LTTWCLVFLAARRCACGRGDSGRTARTFGARVFAADIADRFGDLARDGKVTRTGAHVRITDGERTVLEQSTRETELLEARVRQKFEQNLSACCPGLATDEVWKAFEKDLLTPLVLEMENAFEPNMGHGRYRGTSKFREFMAATWSITRETQARVSDPRIPMSESSPFGC
jgi:hypothetical protein